MKQLVVGTKAARRLRKGDVLIKEDDVQIKLSEAQGSCVKVVDEAHRFLGMAYLAKQHKGMAWIYSRKPNVLLNQVFFEELFQTACVHRESFFADSHTTAFRLFNGEGDGFGGITADWYDGYIVLSWYSQGAFTYKREIIQAFCHNVPHLKGIYEKNRFDGKGIVESALVWGKKAPEPLYVLENDITYACYLDEGLMTGIFLDQRDVRLLLRNQYSKGNHILNTFSYTGAFSVAAAVGGAASTTSVDVAKRSLPKTKEQFACNGYDDTSNSIYVMDVFEYIKYAMKKEIQFDGVVVDPPSFARTKKRVFSVAKDYTQLVFEVAQLVRVNGFLVLSTNAANVSNEQFDKMIDRGLKQANRTYHIDCKMGLPKDFPDIPSMAESHYLKIRFIRLDV